MFNFGNMPEKRVTNFFSKNVEINKDDTIKVSSL
jgi:hypothetical protein